jgi:hypothetical protein
MTSADRQNIKDRMHANCDRDTAKPKKNAQKNGCQKSKQERGHLEWKTVRVEEVAMRAGKDQTDSDRSECDRKRFFAKPLAN